MSTLATLPACEAVIERGLHTFVEVGNALMSIRDRRLYKESGFKSFEIYCRERWGMSRPRAHQLVGAAEVMTNLSTIVDRTPATESQARPLTKLPLEQQAEAWQEAIDTAPGGKVTAKHVAEVVDRRRGVHVANNSGNNEWYTPLDYLAAARKVLGSVDLDPASCAVANQNVGAARFFSEADDGLGQEWSAGSLWMNPPYAQPLIGRFVDKLYKSIKSGSVERAVVLVNNGTETQWGQQLLSICKAVCFPSRRVRFLDPEGNPSGSPLQGQMVVGLGDIEPSDFRAAFVPLGTVMYGSR